MNYKHLILIKKTGIIYPVIIFIYSILMLVSSITNGQNHSINFDSFEKADNWNLVFKDKGTKDWTENWTLDGLMATVKNTKKGMHFVAGLEARNDAHHAVLWTKESYVGDIKIEYDYKRTDIENR